ncbi:cytochrome P450 [Kribbella sp. NBC_01505]|uniref:cytochrome P450 n=1 Tax=Kribbella sp. NBC_01505 TaxID=2903580 RepID=UPI0038690B95
MTENSTRPAFPLDRPSGCPFDPASGYAALREREAPSKVSTPLGVDAWVFTRYDEVRTVLRDPRLSSRYAPSEHVMVGADLEREVESGSILQNDGQAHRRLRRLLATEFAVKRMEAYRPRVAKLIDEHIDAMLAAGGPLDLVEAFALPIPSLVICELLGVPYEDRAEFQHRSSVLVAIDAEPEETMTAMEGLQRFMVALVQAKQVKRDDDLLSRVITRGEELGEDLTIEELVSIGFTLLIAGHETTANMIALSTLALLREPGQLEALREKPELAATAVEELLRYLSVVHFGVFRHVTDDIPADPATIEAGDFLVAALSAANRDASVFENPDELDVTRSGPAHVAFGFGPHQCLGQQLARVELQEVFTRLYARIPTLRLAVPFEEIQFKNNTLVYGVQALPVTW